MNENQYKPATHEEWYILIDEQEESGLTQKEFCNLKNISLVQFGYHIRRRKKLKKSPSESTSSFSPVLINKPNLKSEIKIDLPNGFKCHVSCDVHTDQLKNILGALLSC